jgi:DNA polymerase I-like protein with 3'-5' exonuclease and polymerase domains
MDEYPDLSQFPYFAIDTETTGLKWWERDNKIFGFSISTPDGKDYYYDIQKEPKSIEWIRDNLKRYKGIVIAQNAKFDAHFFWECHGIQLPNLDDTMTRAALIDEHLWSYGLDNLGQKYIGVGKMDNILEELARIFGGKPNRKQMENLHRAPYELVSKYAKQDTRVTLDLWEWQTKEIIKQDLGKVADLERRLLPVLVRMERGGIRINVSGAEKAVDTITESVKRYQDQLNEMAGFPVNPNPSGSISQLFNPRQEGKNWVLCDGTIADVTEGGKASINADVLRRMKHPCAEIILKLRKLIKTRDTFLKGHLLGYQHNSYIHANFNQTKSDNDLGTGTGRLSCNNPALQQIHKRDTDTAAIVRSLFLPDIGQDFVCNDWAQMDFRVFAHYVNNPTINARYFEDPDMDFHQLVSDMTGIPRKPGHSGGANAKQINLGLIFGQGAGSIAQDMGLPYTVETGYKGKEYLKPGDEAAEVFENYHRAVPGVRDLLRNASSIAKARGYVKTIIGRKIRFPGGQFTHKAGGLIFQGSAADALKVKLIELDNYLESTGSDSRILMNVHDEFDTSIEKGRDDIRANINRIVTGFGKGDEINFRVPIRTSQGVGANWWEACRD